ncbi:MAG: peptidoglycan-binding domain-containing protein [Planctomycetota bacterium]
MLGFVRFGDEEALMKKHMVKAGEHFAEIASSHGWGDYEALWEHADNAELRELRPSPHILEAGDIVRIPEIRMKSAAIATEQKHRFRVTRPTLLLRVDIGDLIDEEDEAGRECTLHVGAREYTLVADDNGVIEQRVPIDEKDALLMIDGVDYPLRIGHLDTIETESGQRQRLANLGYLDDKAAEVGEADAFCAAVEEFQEEAGLTVDGICGPQTQGRLLEEHGS